MVGPHLLNRLGRRHVVVDTKQSRDQKPEASKGDLRGSMIERQLPQAGEGRAGGKLTDATASLMPNNSNTHNNLMPCLRRDDVSGPNRHATRHAGADLIATRRPHEP